MRTMPRCFRLLAIGVALAMGAVSGCGGGDEPPTQDGPPTAEGDGPATNGTAPAASNEKPASTASFQHESSGGIDTTVHVDADGRRWFGNIPYDVFYQDPLAVAADNTVASIPSQPAPGGKEVPQIGAPPGKDPSAGSEEPAGGGDDWSKIISKENLDAEVKSVRNRLQAKLQTLAAYNTGYLELPPHIATLTAMAGIATLHPDAVSWKDNAKYVRDLSAGMLQGEKLMRGAKSFKRIQVPFEQIAVILSGGSPAGLPDSKDQVPFADVVDFGMLMKRLELGSKWLRINASNKDALKSQAEDISREAAVVAALAKVITTKGYGYAEDKEFKGYARPMREGGMQMVESVKAQDFEKFQEGYNAVFQACSQCHGVYR